MTTDTATPETPESTEETPKQQVFEDQLQQLYFESLSKLILERNDVVGRANAANGDVATLTEQIRENSDDPAIVEAREQMSKWILELDRLVKPKVEEALANKGEDTNKLEEEIKKADLALKPGVKYYKEMYGEEAASFFPKQARLVGVQVRSAGGRRIRGYSITVTLDGKDTTFENFSSAAKFVGVDTFDLQKGFMGKAGTEKAEEFPDEVSFSINYPETDADGNESQGEAWILARKTDAQIASDASDNSENSNGTEEPSDVDDSDGPDEDSLDEDDIASAL